MSSLNSADSFDTPKGNDLYPELSSPMYDNAGQSGEPTGTGTVTAETPVISDEQRQEWMEEMEKVEGEIATLRQVLGSKIRYTAELKRKLGITPLQELRQDFQLGVKSIKESNTYQKTNDKLHEINDKIHQSSAYQKTSAVAKSAADKTTSVVTGIGSSVTRKLGDLRNSETFKSVEGKVGSAYASVKAKVSGSRSEGNFEEALLEEANRDGNNAESVTTAQPMPEQKVPL